MNLSRAIIHKAFYTIIYLVSIVSYARPVFSNGVAKWILMLNLKGLRENFRKMRIGKRAEMQALFLIGQLGLWRSLERNSDQIT